MAKVPHLLFFGMRGRIGEVVFRQLNGRTYTSRRPRRYRPAFDESLVDTVDSVTAAAAYARRALRDPKAKALYLALATPALGARKIAQRDFLTAPIVHKIALGLFDGLAGDEIIITV